MRLPVHAPPSSPSPHRPLARSGTSAVDISTSTSQSVRSALSGCRNGRTVTTGARRYIVVPSGPAAAAVPPAATAGTGGDLRMSSIRADSACTWDTRFPSTRGRRRVPNVVASPLDAPMTPSLRADSLLMRSNRARVAASIFSRAVAVWDAPRNGREHTGSSRSASERVDGMPTTPWGQPPFRGHSVRIDHPPALPRVAWLIPGRLSLSTCPPCSTRCVQ